jgi:HAD superfamily hydrolase (TIGR01662 family)
VGKGLTLREDLELIHSNMTSEILHAGGRIDEVFYCPDLDDNSPYRKPNPGMGLQAKAKYPEINFSQSIMVGNTLSDMEFGRNLGAYNVFIRTTHPEITAEDNRIDICFDTLSGLAEWLTL